MSIRRILFSSGCSESVQCLLDRLRQVGGVAKMALGRKIVGLGDLISTLSSLQSVGDSSSSSAAADG